MKNTLFWLLLVLFFSHFAQAQTITKVASNSNPYIGQEFYYTITVDDLTNLSDLDYIMDNFGPELDYIGVDYDPIMQYLISFGPVTGIGCASYSDSASTIHNFRLDFNNCNGNVVGNFDSFSFKIKVKLNELACGLPNAYDNKAELYLKSAPAKSIKSNLESIIVNKSDPFVLQKTFRSSLNRELIYDIRLSSSSGNFYPMDFGATPTFRDTFTIPSCLTIGVNDVDVVLITDETTTPMIEATNFTYNTSITGNVLNIDWDLQGATEETTSILYLVKFKNYDCTTCGNTSFNLKNRVAFNASDRCGNPIKKSKKFDIENAYCINGEIEIPAPISTKICLSKKVQLDGNNLNLTMKGCTGKYIITIDNCSGRITYKDFKLTDIIPRELRINGPITINGNATHIYSSNGLEVTQTAYLLPYDSVEITVPFSVDTSDPNITIDNCAEISLYGYDDYNKAYNVTEKDCAPTLVTVPNEVTVVANKILCSDAKNECGPFTDYANLPGDYVEYALHFYNYGTVEARDVVIRDVLPAHFEIENINSDVQIYIVDRSNIDNVCKIETKTPGKGIKDIDAYVNKNYSSTTNLLEIKLGQLFLDEFTCDGILQYVVKIKAKINLNAPNGVYNNIFVVNYTDPNDRNNNTAISNKVTNVVNVNNLVIGSKTLEAFETDCINKTKKVSYKITMANMGTFPVSVNINDVLSVPNPASVVSIVNFQLSINGGPFTPNPVSNANISGFHINGMGLLPCEYKTISYDVIYNTNQITGNETVQVCNSATAEVFIKDNKRVIPLVTANPSLIQNYFKATSDVEKLKAIEFIKSYKQDSKYDISNPIEFDDAVLGNQCVTLSDCLFGSESACFTDGSPSFNFQITGMNSNGQISTTLNNSPTNRITQIEYLLTDIRQIDTCEDKVRTGTFRGRKFEFVENCFGCSENVTGIFSTTDISPIGLLQYNIAPALPGTYRESNSVSFKGLLTSITQDSRTFNFPVGINCNGTYEFTITAIVHFEDCSVCYVTDSFDYNASFIWRIPNPRPPVLNGPFTPTRL